MKSFIITINISGKESNLTSAIEAPDAIEAGKIALARNVDLLPENIVRIVPAPTKLSIKTVRYNPEMRSEMGEANPIGAVIVANHPISHLNGTYSFYSTGERDELKKEMREKAKPA